MSAYTPTTEEIREYIEVGGEPRPWVALDEAEEALEGKRSAAFDRWLAAHDAEVAAKALEDAAGPPTVLALVARLREAEAVIEKLIDASQHVVGGPIPWVEIDGHEWDAALDGYKPTNQEGSKT